MVFPVVIQQIDRWGALRTARDLSHLRLTLEQFHGDVWNHPQYLTQAFYPITTSQVPLWESAGNTTPYTAREVARWHGPYLDAAMAEDLGVDFAWESGLGIQITNTLFCADPTAPQIYSLECKKGEWVAVYMFKIDPGEADQPRSYKATNGRLLFSSYGGIAGDTDPGDIYYLATPYMMD
jgi:hypothetical protein